MKKILLSIAVAAALGMTSCGGVSPEEADKVCSCYIELNEKKVEMEQQEIEKKLQECEQMSVDLQEKDMKAFDKMKQNCTPLK